MHPSRRDFLATSAALTAGAILGRPLHLLAAQRAQAAQAVFTPVRRNVGTFTMRGGTVGWLVNARGVAVVDTQFPAEAQALLAGLRERSGNRGVDVLLNTHHHGDHTSGNGVFRGVARRVVAHGMADQHMRRAAAATAGAARAAAPAAAADAASSSGAAVPGHHLHAQLVHRSRGRAHRREAPRACAHER